MMKALALVIFSLALFNCVYAFSVSGNQLLDGNGKVTLLRGVDRPSFEWSNVGQDTSANDYVLMAGWGANVVRITSNQDFWLSTSSSYSSGYKAVIQQQVTWAKAAGLNVIIDLHWSDQGNLAGTPGQQNMADQNSITFWGQVAQTFANDPKILFELYNEPHDVSWSVWLNGGTASSSGTGYAVAGMQQLYNAVRQYANNTVICGGLNYAFDLSGVANNPVQGFNIMYATHPYDYSGKQSGDWDAAFGYLAATHPVIMTEFGQYCNNDTYVSDLLAYAQNKNLHWTAWAWWVQDCTFPSIIADWNGTPLGTVGTLVKQYLSSGAASTTKSPTTAPTTAPSTSTTTTKAPTTTKAATNPTTTTTKSATSAPTAAPTTAKANSTATTTTTKPATSAPTTTKSGTTSGCSLTVTFSNGNINFNNVGTQTIHSATFTVSGTLSWSNLVLVSGSTYSFPTWESSLSAGQTWGGAGYQNNGPTPTFTNISPSC